MMQKVHFSVYMNSIVYDAVNVLFLCELCSTLVVHSVGSVTAMQWTFRIMRCSCLSKFAVLLFVLFLVIFTPRVHEIP